MEQTCTGNYLNCNNKNYCYTNLRIHEKRTELDAPRTERCLIFLSEADFYTMERFYKLFFFVTRVLIYAIGNIMSKWYWTAWMKGVSLHHNSRRRQMVQNGLQVMSCCCEINKYIIYQSTHLLDKFTYYIFSSYHK